MNANPLILCRTGLPGWAITGHGRAELIEVIKKAKTTTDGAAAKTASRNIFISFLFDTGSVCGACELLPWFCMFI